MRGKIIIFFIVTVLSHGVHAGDIFRCVAANGDVMFTNMTCPPNSLVQHFASYTPVPDVPARTNDAAVRDAAVSAEQALAAAQQAKTAAYQARMASEQAEAEAQSEQSSGEDEYAAGWIPFYPQVGAHSYNRQGYLPQAVAGHSVAHSSHHLPHAQRLGVTFHR